MPLNRLRVSPVTYPPRSDDVFPLLDKLKLKDRERDSKAFEQVRWRVEGATDGPDLRQDARLQRAADGPGLRQEPRSERHHGRRRPHRPQGRLDGRLPRRPPFPPRRDRAHQDADGALRDGLAPPRRRQAPARRARSDGHPPRRQDPDRRGQAPPVARRPSADRRGGVGGAEGRGAAADADRDAREQSGRGDDDGRVDARADRGVGGRARDGDGGRAVGRRGDDAQVDGGRARDAEARSGRRDEEALGCACRAMDAD